MPRETTHPPTHEWSVESAGRKGTGAGWRLVSPPLPGQPPAAPHSVPGTWKALPQVAPHERLPAIQIPHPGPAYLLSRQAIHSAEDGECAACAATMLGSGARWPRAAATSRAPPGGLPRPAGRGPRGGPGAGPALHCGARPRGSPATPPAGPPARSRDPEAPAAGAPLRPARAHPHLLRASAAGGHPGAPGQGMSDSLYIFRTANATKMAAASRFP